MRALHLLRRFYPALAAIVFSLVCFAQTPYIFYKQRGNYSEGIRAGLSTVPNLLLIAAMVDYSEPYNNLPDKFQALFYLPTSVPVTLAVRESDPRYDYWLQTDDKAVWKSEAANPFQWPTSEVVKSLNYKGPPLALGDLGATARLGSAAPGEDERVAPVALFHSRPPEKAAGYKFAWRAEAQARLTFSIYSESTRAPIGKPQLFELDAKKSKWVRWPADGWGEGWYRLTVTGQWVADNQSIAPHAVHFYHRVNLAR